jgi:hypothetical protein
MRCRVGIALAAAVALSCLSSATAAPAGAATAATTLATLNAQRAANGLPAGIVEDPALSSGCAAHDLYMSENGGLTHVEQAGHPGYTVSGANAGQNAVLSQGAGWDTGNPYETAPLHLDQLLAPRLQVVGTADADGFSCTTTFPGWTRADPATTTIYTYPGPGATIYPSEVASELPFTPGQLVGLSSAAQTGPYLIVLADAPGQSPLGNTATLSHATLTGPHGRVAVATVDGSTPATGGSVPTLAAYLSPGGFIIPVHPLAPASTYDAHVVVDFGGTKTTHDWAFTTQGLDPASSLTVSGPRLVFQSHSAAPIRISLTRANGKHAAAIRLAPGQSATPHLAAGSWQACGAQPARGGYTGFQRCVTLVVTGKPVLGLGTPRLSGLRLVVPVRYGNVLRRRRATLVLLPLTCTARHCRTAGRARTWTVRLRGATLVLPAPSPGRGVRIVLSTAAFQLGDAPWAAARATASFTRP